MKRVVWIILSFLLALSMCGCQRIPEEKTIELPNAIEQNQTSLKEQSGMERYAVEKIYTTDYLEAFQGNGGSWFQEAREDRICYWKREQTELSLVSTDYRYGFYDEEELKIKETQIYEMENTMNLFSNDGETICYGYVPENVNEPLELYRMDGRSGRILGGQDFNNIEGFQGITNGKPLRLYIQRLTSQLLVAIIEKTQNPGIEEAHIFLWDEFVVYKDSFFIKEGGTLYFNELDALLYGCFYKGDSYNEYIFYATPLLNSEQKQFIGIPGLNSNIRVLTMTDEGDAAFTAEVDKYTGEADIYLYLKTNNGFSKKLLYKNAGDVYSIQYDSMFHRLLVDTCISSDSINEDERVWHKALVMEFN